MEFIRISVDTADVMDYLQTMDYVSLGLVALPIMAVVFCGYLLLGRGKNDTMQRSSSKASHNHHSKSQRDVQQQQHSNPLNLKNDSSDSGVSTSGGSSPNNSLHHHHHHHHHNQQQQQQQQQHHHHHHHSNQQAASGGKQRKSRSSNGKRQDLVGGKRSTATVDAWLRHSGRGETMMFCYEQQQRFVSSCNEDNLTARHHKSVHRDSTSSDAAASDDLNSSSSNEDLSTVAYAAAAVIVQGSVGGGASVSVPTGGVGVVGGGAAGGGGKKSKSRQKRQQKRAGKQPSLTMAASATTAALTMTTMIANSTSAEEDTPMDIDDDEAKENYAPYRKHQHQHQQQQHQQHQHQQHNHHLPQQLQQQQQQQHGGFKSSNGINLRKQCTKAAALKALNAKATNPAKHTHSRSGAGIANVGIVGGSGGGGGIASLAQSSALPSTTPLTTSASNSSVCSSLSSVSSASTLSIPSSVSSSASSSPAGSPTALKRTAEHIKKIARALAPPLKQHNKLNMSEQELVQHLRRYIIDPNLLRVYGYPVESAIHEGCIEIYKCLPKPFNGATTHHHHHHHHNSSATGSTTMYGLKSNVINVHDGLEATAILKKSVDGDQTQEDSGQGSGNSSPPSVDSEDNSEVGDGEGEDEPSGATAFYTPDGSYQIFSQYDQSLEKQCVRCTRSFHVTDAGDYLRREECVFHWGKLNQMYTSTSGFGYQYSCCQGDQSTDGCSRNPLHVWTGAVVGLNGPYTDFVHTRTRRGNRTPHIEPAPHNPAAADDSDDCVGARSARKQRQTKVYALDCEMSFTGRGLEVTKVTVVGHDGQMVYEHFVRPHAEIVDYNTRFSGITAKDLTSGAATATTPGVKTLPEVQRDLLQLFDADTILIGHGLDNDLRVLRIVHKTIIDTSIAFPHASGFPYRRALKHLTKICLNRDIQVSEAGHSSFEDSRACLELMLWKVRKDMRQEYSH